MKGRQSRITTMVLTILLGACGPTAGGDDDDDDDIDGGIDCPGCVCQPGSSTCNGDTEHVCNSSGTGWVDHFCDPVQGSSCNPDTGRCTGPCAPDALGDSYIGCDYYPTVSGNIVLDYFQFAVAVANTSNEVAMVTIDEGALTAPMTFSVNPNEVQVQRLPWQTALKLCTNTTPPDGFLNQECGAPQNQGALVAKGAFHLRSTQPVTVYQFSALDYTVGGFFSFTNDASLLLPTNVMTGNYLVATSPAWDTATTGGAAGVFPSLTTVTATQDGTMVTVSARAATPGGGGAPAFQANVPQTVGLNRGDVLELASFAGDLSGTTVQADKPVQVLGGHYCTNLPANVRACDHLEESMFPVETLSTQYLVTAPYLPGLGAPKVQNTRIVATAANTMVTVDPVPAGVTSPILLANPGDVAEIAQRSEDFLLTSNNKILVAHFMLGQEAGGNSGDPAYTLAVATDQYRTSYIIHAPTNYESNFANITAPVGATVMLDGTAVTGLTALGTTGFAVARVPLPNGANGNHSLTSAEPFGVEVYGYGQYTSYWYPGGLDLSEIPVP